MLAFSFLVIAVLGGVGLLGKGYHFSTLHGRTTAGLCLFLAGFLVLVLSYGSAVEWGIIRI